MKNQLNLLLATCLNLFFGTNDISGQKLDKKGYLKEMRIAGDAYDNGDFPLAADLYQASFKNMERSLMVTIG